MKYEIDCGKNKCHSSIKEIKSGDVTELLFEVAFDEPTSPERITVIWREPVWETYSYWGPNLGTLRHLASHFEFASCFRRAGTQYNFGKRQK